MRGWLGELNEMYEDLLAEFGEQIAINGVPTIAVPAESFEEISMMRANITRLCIARASGVRVKKGHSVDYRNREYSVVDVPEYVDELIYFNLKP